MTLKEVTLKYTNDYNLGEFIRFNYSKIFDFPKKFFEEMIKKYDDDYKLGEQIRNLESKL